MQQADRTGSGITVVGIFSDIADARRATDELHSTGITTARLIENDQAVTFTGTAENEGAKGHDQRSDWQLSSDVFQDAYNKKQELIIIEDCVNVGLCRDIITAHSGTVDVKVWQRKQAADRDQAAASGLGVDVDRMPFAHPLTQRGDRIGDRVLNGMSGDADRTPLVGLGAHQKGPQGVPPGPA